MLDNLLLGLAAALHLKQFFFMTLGTVIGLWSACCRAWRAGRDGDPHSLHLLDGPALGAADAGVDLGRRAFGGSVTSILLNIPGEASSAATSYDGYRWRSRAMPRWRWIVAGASMVAGIIAC